MTIRLDGSLMFRALAAAALTFAVCACCGGGQSNSCTAAMDYGGGKYSSKGTGSSKADAQKEAEGGVCLAYCQQGDPLVDEVWKKWKSTPDGQRAKTAKSFDVTLHAPLKAVYDKCVARCEADIATKKVSVTTTCTS